MWRWCQEQGEETAAGATSRDDVACKMHKLTYFYSCRIFVLMLLRCRARSDRLAFIFD